MNWSAPIAIVEAGDPPKVRSASAIINAAAPGTAVSTAQRACNSPAVASVASVVVTLA